MKLPDPGETEEVTPVELKALLAADAIRLIDCREEGEYALCRIEGATLIPLQQIPEQFDAVQGEGGRPVIVYCHHGIRSLDATQFLRSRGLENVFSLVGGIDAWSGTIDPDVPRY